MTENGTDSAANPWSTPECPFRIEMSPRVLDDIRLAVVDAFFSLPRGGVEIGGILLGSYQSGKLTIGGHAALECEHAFGPSFTLSPPDEARLKTLLASHAGLSHPVGWYHSHTRSEIFLSDAGLEIHKRYFPDLWQVALVIKPYTFEPARIGFFFREADGSMRTKSAYREISLEALPIRQTPHATRSAEPYAQMPPRRWHEEPPAADRLSQLNPARAGAPPAPEHDLQRDPEPAPEPASGPIPEAAAELSTPRFLVIEPPSRRWVWVLAISLALGGGTAGFQTRQAWLPKVMSAVKPAYTAIVPPPALGLNVLDREGQLQIHWDSNSRVLLDARDAILEISDGTTPQVIQLDRNHLRAGSLTYARQAEKVDVKLIVHRDNAPDVREVTSFLGRLPDKPTEDPAVQKQRDNQARQAARLKLDLDWQANKTKKLEKDLQSIREEMKQQQMKRLNNQLPGK